MKKRTLSWLLCGLTALCIAGCGSNSSVPDTARTDVSEADVSAEEDTATEDLSAEVAVNTQEAIEDAAAEDRADASATEDAEKLSGETATTADFSIGEVNDRTYRNSFLGISFTAPDDMNFSTEEELAQLSSLAADWMGDLEEVQQALENGSVIIACNASSDAGSLPSRSFNITIQNAETIPVPAGEVLSEAYILNTAMEQLPSVLEQNGFTDVKTDLSTITFLGEEHPCMTLSASLPNGATLYERQVGLIQDGYTNSFTAAVVGGEDTTEEILGCVTR